MPHRLTAAHFDRRKRSAVWTPVCRHVSPRGARTCQPRRGGTAAIETEKPRESEGSRSREYMEASPLMGAHTGIVIHLYFSTAGDASWLLLLITGIEKKTNQLCKSGLRHCWMPEDLLSSSSSRLFSAPWNIGTSRPGAAAPVESLFLISLVSPV